MADDFSERVERLRNALDPAVGFRAMQLKVEGEELDLNRLRALGYVRGNEETARLGKAYFTNLLPGILRGLRSWESHP